MSRPYKALKDQNTKKTPGENGHGAAFISFTVLKIT